MSVDELKKQPAEALAVLANGFRSEKVAVLGDGQVFFRRTADGEVQAVTARLKLEQAKGHICKIEGSFMIAAAGLDYMNQVANLNVITPPSLLLPGGEKAPNPFLVMNTDNLTGRKIVEGVWVRKVAFGYGPLGTPSAQDQTLYYDLHNYFIQDLVNKSKKHPEAVQVKMEGAVTDDEKKSRLILPYLYGIVIVADLSHPEVMKVLRTHIQSTKFAERKASTICTRRAMSRHPSIGMTKVQGVDGNDWGEGATAYVQVYGWRHDKTTKQINEMATAAAEGRSVDGTEIITEAAEAGDDPADVIDVHAVQQEDEPETPKATAPEHDDEPTHAEKNVAYFLDQQTTVNGKRKVLVDKYGEKALHAAIDGIPAPWSGMTPKEKAKALDTAAKTLAKNAAAAGADK